MFECLEEAVLINSLHLLLAKELSCFTEVPYLLLPVGVLLADIHLCPRALPIL